MQNAWVATTGQSPRTRYTRTRFQVFIPAMNTFYVRIIADAQRANTSNQPRLFAWPESLLKQQAARGQVHVAE
jgi:hypothetical protein